MNKQEYLNALNEALAPFGDDVRAEIVEDYEQHFENGIAQGKSEEEIAIELGSIDELVEEIRELSGDSSKKDEKKVDFKLKKDSFDKFAKSFATTIGTVAAAITNETEKIIDSAANGAATFTETITSDICEAGGKVADKSVKFAKEIKNSYSANRNSSAKNEEGKETVTEESINEGDAVNEECDIENTADDSIERISYSDIKNLILEIHCGDVTIVKSEDEDFHVDYTNFGTPNQQLIYKYEFSQQNDTAYVSVKKQPGITNFFRMLTSPRIDIVISVPDGFGDIKMNSLSGNMKCKGINVGNICISSMRGTIDFNDCTANDIISSSMAGNVTFSGIDAKSLTCKSNAGNTVLDGKIDDIKAVSTVGDVTITSNYANSITATTTAGNIVVSLEDSTGYEADVDTPVGDVTLSFGESLIKGARKGKYNLGDGSGKVKCRTSAGNITVTDLTIEDEEVKEQTEESEDNA